MFQGINAIQFFANKEDRRWNTANILEYCIIYANGKLPEFIEVIDTVGTSAEIKLYNALTDELITTVNGTNVVSSTKRLIEYIGSTIADKPDGYYYYTLNTGVEILYSEVWGWATDLSNYLKLNIVSQNLTMSGVHEIPFSDLDITIYLQYNGITYENEINEDGVDKPYGHIGVFNTLNIKRKAEINSTKDQYRFISALRIFSINGTITLTVNGVSTEIYDIEINIKDESGLGDTMILELIYKETDFLSVRNEI